MRMMIETEAGYVRVGAVRGRALIARGLAVEVCAAGGGRAVQEDAGASGEGIPTPTEPIGYGRFEHGNEENGEALNDGDGGHTDQG